MLWPCPDTWGISIVISALLLRSCPRWSKVPVGGSIRYLSKVNLNMDMETPHSASTNLGQKCRFQCHSNFRTVFDRANVRLKIYPVKQGSTQLRFSPLLALVISLVLSLKCRHYRKKIDIGHVHLMFTK